jgi:hypothetical protein
MAIFKKQHEAILFSDHRCRILQIQPDLALSCRLALLGHFGRFISWLVAMGEDGVTITWKKRRAEESENRHAR